MYRRYYGGYDENLESGGGFGADEACDCRDECESGCFEDERRPEAECLPAVAGGAGEECSVASVPGKILGPLAIDDIILIGVLLLLMQENSDDKLLLIIIGFILISGFIA